MTTAASLRRTTARPARHSLHGLIAALGLAASFGAAAADEYQLTRFQDPRGLSTNFYPRGINDAFTITGTASFQLGFTLAGGTITTFEVPGAFNNETFGDDINNAGVVVGSYRNGSGGHGFVLANGVFSTVDVPGAARETVVTGINDAGQMVGVFRQAGALTWAGFVQTGSDIQRFDAAQAQPDTFANGINDAGQVVGYVGGGGTNSRGFLYAQGQFEFFDRPGALWTQALGINNRGQVVGAASNGLFVKNGASFLALALPQEWHAADAIASDITDSGVVVGTFRDNTTNLRYGFLAMPTAPVPEPSSIALLLAGGALLAARRRLPRR